MVLKKTTSNPSEQLKEALEWCGESEASSRKVVMIDKDVFNIAEKISKKLGTGIEGVFTLAAYRILKKRDLL